MFTKLPSVRINELENQGELSVNFLGNVAEDINLPSFRARFFHKCDMFIIMILVADVRA